MASPLDTLRSLLAGDTITQGKVVRVDGGVATIATAKGLRQAQLASGVRVGDSVIIQRGIASRSTATTRQYSV